MSEEVKIVETGKVPLKGTLIFAFPDVGLVGVIAGSHLIDELGMVEVASLNSNLLPPVIVLHDGLPHSSIRIFSSQDTLLALSEIPIPSDILLPIMNALFHWAKSKQVKMMISLSGMPIQDRQDATELKSFAAASNAEALEIAKEKGLEILTEGYMVGPQAVLLQHAAETGSQALTLLAQCFYNYPDPEAAAEVLKDLTKLTGLKVNIQKLLEKGEEIRLRARDVMKRTQDEMTKMKKGQEYDIPMYVS